MKLIHVSLRYAPTKTFRAKNPQCPVAVLHSMNVMIFVWNFKWQKFMCELIFDRILRVNDPAYKIGRIRIFFSRLLVLNKTDLYPLSVWFVSPHRDEMKMYAILRVSRNKIREFWCLMIEIFRVSTLTYWRGYVKVTPEFDNNIECMPTSVFSKIKSEVKFKQTETNTRTHKKK